MESWKESVKNDFEMSLFPKYPVLKEIKERLYHKGAKYAAMSGSGSTLFGIFEEETDLADIFNAYKVWQGYLK